MKRFYLVAATVGTIIPWLFFGQFINAEGVNLSLFLASLPVNSVTRGATADLLISILIFWVWAYTDARKRGIRYWWLTIVAGFTVGLSLALPLYLYMREDAA
ncbi:MAG: DUF2834 domain-containing protein [Anaerolineaceae bacterium]|nr:DUF2834 domain-containing protein [Anaerolineaceae bacterium]